MKKLYAVIISILVLCGSVFMSGCSDFTFNPIGKWENIETKTVDGLDVEDPYDRSFYLIFRHDGSPKDSLKLASIFASYNHQYIRQPCPNCQARLKAKRHYIHKGNDI